MARRRDKNNQVTAVVVVSNEHPTPADIEAALHEKLRESIVKWSKRTVYGQYQDKDRLSSDK